MAAIALALVDQDWLRRAIDASLRNELWGKRWIFPGNYTIAAAVGGFRQRPHTDDMRQMLEDLDIEWPEFEPVSFDGQHFHLDRTREDPWGRERSHEAAGLSPALFHGGLRTRSVSLLRGKPTTRR